MSKRQKIQHLRATRSLNINTAKDLDFQYGEIAIKHGEIGKSELYILSKDGNAIETFVPKSYIDSRFFVGTQEQYNEAFNEGKIINGALVIITDESPTSPVIGNAELGQSILDE
jgi:hypothetical protein